jgi:hypothetical protein
MAMHSPFDISEAEDGTNIINILRFVSNAAPPPFPSNAAPPPFPAGYDTSKEGLELLRHDLFKYISPATRKGIHHWNGIARS